MDEFISYYGHLLSPRLCFVFIIAGISPKLKVIDSAPRVCSNCGLSQAYLKRADSYLTLFFIPILRVKKGDPFIICDRCETVISDQSAPFRKWEHKTPEPCEHCGRTVQNGFLYCPYCGKRI